MRGRSLGTLALAALAACSPDTVAAGDYGGVDGGDEPTVDPGTLDASIDPGPSTGSDGASAAASEDGDARATAAPLDACDLTGRWLATDREVATGLGAKEAAHSWLYYEIRQTGSQLTVTKGLDCGEAVVGISSVSANVDYRKTWPALMTKAAHTGRKGTSTKSSSGCAVTFAKLYTVVGATVSLYTDPSQTMPTLSQQAATGTPGWEDWDNDGNPGITMNVSGLATGQIYVAIRRYSAFSGTIASGTSTFDLTDDWNSEQDLLGYSGSSLLTAATSGARDNVAAEHFVTFVRLGANQATGSDDATCTAVRSLAPGLTPQASN